MSKRGGAASGQLARTVKSRAVRSIEVLKCPTLKKDAATGMPIDNKVKWQKRYLVLADGQQGGSSPGLYYWKDSMVRSKLRRRLFLIVTSKLCGCFPLRSLMLARWRRRTVWRRSQLGMCCWTGRR